MFKSKKTWIRIACLVLLVALCVSCMYAFADVGNHNSYGRDSSGSGGGSSTSGSDSSIFFIIYALLRLGPMGWVILIVLAVGFLWLRKNGVLNKTETMTNDTNRTLSGNKDSLTDNSISISEKIKETDPSFSHTKFIEWGKEVFVQLQKAWMNRDWKLARPFESDSLFKTHQMQLDQLISNKEINIIDNICVNKAFLTKYYVDGDYEFISMFLDVKMTDYVINEDTKAVLRGNPNILYRPAYILTFMRSIGTTTNPASSNKSTTNCPNCGAPTDITSSGQCRYCDSVITTGKHDWVLCSLDSN